MSKILILIALLAAQLSPSFGGDLDFKKGDTAGPEKVSNSMGMKITAKSAIVVDRKSQKVLFEKNSNEQVSMASLTKLMTAIVFLDNFDKKLSAKFLVPVEATLLEGADIDLLHGEEITYKDLLWGALIGSGNDAAESLAISLGKKDFINKMNEKAREIGLDGTHFSGVTGLDAKDHYSNAGDLVKLLDYAISNKTIKEAVQVKEFDAHALNADHIHHIVNTNRLLRFDYPKIKGGKTGYTENAGFCLASWSEDKKGNEIIVVVLGSDLNGNQFQDTKALIDWTYNNYSF